jgi:hypothetical protein
MSHRDHIARINGLQLIHHGDDISELGDHIVNLTGSNFQSGKHAQLVDVVRTQKPAPAGENGWVTEGA